MTGSDESAVVFLPTIFMSLSYVLWAVLMLWLSGLLVRRRPSWQVWLMPGVLVVAGFLVRIAAMQGGPGDLRINIADAVTTRIALGGWGSAPVAFFRMVGWFVPLSGVSIMLVNALLAALVPALVYLLVLELRCSRVAALASAVLTVIYPVLMVFARVINRQPTYLWLSFLALYFLARFLRRQEWPDLVPVAIAAILAAWSRPEGAVILVPLMVLALFQARTMKLRVVLVGAGGILCIGAWLYVSLPVFGGLYDSSASIDWFNAIRIWPRVLLFDPDFTPLAQTLVWIAGLVWGFRYRPRLAATAVLTVLLLEIGRASCRERV